MKKSEISPEVRRFVLVSLPSLPHMEALMLVRATAPSRWTALYLSQRLYVTPATAADILADLYNSALLLRDEASSTYFYQFKAHAIAETIEQLALYANNLVEITVLIQSKSGHKAQQFTDAFDFRNDSKDV